jgi:hypothetical protein
MNPWQFPGDVLPGLSHILARIQVGDPAWETTVPAVVAEVIKTKNLFRSR